MFLTNVQHLFCNSSTGTKTVFPHKIYLPKGDLPLENEIAVAMSKAFGHRKRKYEFKNRETVRGTITAASNLVVLNNHQINILIMKSKIINILIMFIASINCTTFELFGK